MKPDARWAAVGVMFLVLVVLFLVAPKIAVAFAVGVLLIGLGSAWRTGKLSLK